MYEEENDVLDTDPADDPVSPVPEPLGGGAGDADHHDPSADDTGAASVPESATREVTGSQDPTD
jgi:hypothetical protein